MLCSSYSRIPGSTAAAAAAAGNAHADGVRETVNAIAGVRLHSLCATAAAAALRVCLHRHLSDGARMERVHLQMKEWENTGEQTTSWFPAAMTPSPAIQQLYYSSCV